MKTKEELRKQIKKIRDLIPEKTRREKSLQVCDEFFSLPKLQGDIVDLKIMSFLSFSSEIDTVPMINKLWERGAQVYLPRVNSIKNRSMDLVLYTPKTQMKKSKYGILEPMESPLAEPGDLDIIIVPALAFDKNNKRLGYGGGFYDTLLQSIRKDCLKVGICFREQVLDEIPLEEHDQAVDLVIFK